MTYHGCGASHNHKLFATKKDKMTELQRNCGSLQIDTVPVIIILPAYEYILRSSLCLVLLILSSGELSA